MANIGYLDIGALQSKDSGSPDPNKGYLDIGALQHQGGGGGGFQAAWARGSNYLISVGEAR